MKSVYLFLLVLSLFAQSSDEFDFEKGSYTTVYKTDQGNTRYTVGFDCTNRMEDGSCEYHRPVLVQGRLKKIKNVLSIGEEVNFTEEWVRVLSKASQGYGKYEIPYTKFEFSAMALFGIFGGDVAGFLLGAILVVPTVVAELSYNGFIHVFLWPKRDIINNRNLKDDFYQRRAYSKKVRVSNEVFNSITKKLNLSFN